ncbi:helix-turn-helix domain-containing protein [Providencia sp.]|uniref:helix-turn-helix domain-containing protein n=1 Tax=Providencia sp. TaxID=589 RepID=UPI003341283E
MDEIKKIANMLTQQRKSLGLEQKDMYMRIGMKQQQYQRVEAGNDIKLSTFLRVLEGLNLELSIGQKGSSKSSVLGSNPNNQSEEWGNTEIPENDDLDFWSNITRSK